MVDKAGVGSIGFPIVDGILERPLVVYGKSVHDIFKLEQVVECCLLVKHPVKTDTGDHGREQIRHVHQDDLVTFRYYAKQLVYNNGIFQKHRQGFFVWLHVQCLVDMAYA